MWLSEASWLTRLVCEEWEGKKWEQPMIFLYIANGVLRVFLGFIYFGARVLGLGFEALGRAKRKGSRQ